MSSFERLFQSEKPPMEKVMDNFISALGLTKCVMVIFFLWAIYSVVSQGMSIAALLAKNMELGLCISLVMFICFIVVFLLELPSLLRIGRLPVADYNKDTIFGCVMCYFLSEDVMFYPLAIASGPMFHQGSIIAIPLMIGALVCFTLQVWGIAYMHLNRGGVAISPEDM